MREAAYNRIAQDLRDHVDMNKEDDDFAEVKKAIVAQRKEAFLEITKLGIPLDVCVKAVAAAQARSVSDFIEASSSSSSSESESDDWGGDDPVKSRTAKSSKPSAPATPKTPTTTPPAGKTTGTQVAAKKKKTIRKKAESSKRVAEKVTGELKQTKGGSMISDDDDDDDDDDALSTILVGGDEADEAASAGASKKKWTVEALRDRTIDKGVTWYEVKWGGSEETTWQEREVLCEASFVEAMCDEYDEKHPYPKSKSKKGKKVQPRNSTKKRKKGGPPGAFCWCARFAAAHGGRHCYPYDRTCEEEAPSGGNAIRTTARVKRKPQVAARTHSRTIVHVKRKPRSHATRLVCAGAASTPGSPTPSTASTGTTGSSQGRLETARTLADFEDYFELVNGEEVPEDVEWIHVGSCGTKGNVNKAVPGTVLEHDTFEGRFLLTGHEASATQDKYLLVYRADDDEVLDASKPDEYATRAARMQSGHFRVSSVQPPTVNPRTSPRKKQKTNPKKAPMVNIEGIRNGGDAPHLEAFVETQPFVDKVMRVFKSSGPSRSQTDKLRDIALEFQESDSSYELSTLHYVDRVVSVRTDQILQRDSDEWKKAFTEHFNPLVGPVYDSGKQEKMRRAAIARMCCDLDSRPRRSTCLAVWAASQGVLVLLLGQDKAEETLQQKQKRGAFA